MKVQSVCIFLWYSVLFRIVPTISKLRPNEDIGHHGDFIDIYDIIENWTVPHELKVNLRIDTREIDGVVALPVNNDDLSRITKKLNFKKKLVFIIHGFLSDGEEAWTKQLSAAYLKQKDVTVFTVDWGTGAKTPNYIDAVQKTGTVAKQLIDFTKLLIEHGAKASHIHILGHSLGAHIAGFVGKGIPHVGRITGLDPANPGFSENIPSLSKGDATHVDIVHTSAIFGKQHSKGDVDFYMNGGGVQRGCDSVPWFETFIPILGENICSHSRATHYFIESIENLSCTFIGSKTLERANSVRWNDFDPNNDAVLGLDTFKYESKGDYYLMTNSAPPYCKS